MNPPKEYVPTVGLEDEEWLKDIFADIVACARMDSQFDETQALEMFTTKILTKLFSHEN